MSGAIETRISTSMTVVNMMGIADPFLDFDYRDFSITLDGAAKALNSSFIDVFGSIYARFIASEFSIGAITIG
jgi:hypothetical protein